MKWGKVAQDQSDLVPSSNVNDSSNYFPPQFYDFLWFFEITWITSLHNLTDGNDGLDEVCEDFFSSNFDFNLPAAKEIFLQYNTHF